MVIHEEKENGKCLDGTVIALGGQLQLCLRFFKVSERTTKILI